MKYDYPFYMTSIISFFFGLNILFYFIYLFFYYYHMDFLEQ